MGRGYYSFGAMKRIFFFLWVLLYFFTAQSNNALADEKIKLKLFYASGCKHCIVIREQYLPEIISKYKDKIEIEYLNIAEQQNFQQYLALEKKFNVKTRVPLILIGSNLLIGSTQIKERLEPVLREFIPSSFIPKAQIGKEDLLHKFSSFSPLAVIAAGLFDGINPCAFTVLIFFISFLTLMGYKKKDLLFIGLTFILAVFLTYLAIGLGLFRGFYELKHFYSFLKITYYGIAVFCFILAYLNLQDFFEYRKTKSTDSLKVKLPKPVRSRINAIISVCYRKDPNEHFGIKAGLIGATFIVGFLVSLLEAVCTGQVYLPTIVFILKEPALRLRALSYLLLYNFMFVFPLLLILLFAVLGVSSKKIEEFFRGRIALIKIVMFILFLGLGIFLIAGI